MQKEGVSGMTKKEEEIHIICRLHCEAQNRSRVHELLLEYVEPARQENGCLYYDIFQERDDPNAFYILDGWRDQAAVDSHVKHPNVLRVNSLIEPLVIGKQTLTFGQRLSEWPENSTEEN